MKKTIKTMLAFWLTIAATNALGQTSLGNVPTTVDVNDVKITSMSYLVFSSRDTVIVNPQTGCADTVSIDMGAKVYSAEEYEARQKILADSLVQRARRMPKSANAPVVIPDGDWTYEGKQERSSARLYSFTYPSVDADGNTVRLSALMGVPHRSVVSGIIGTAVTYFTYSPLGWVVSKAIPDPQAHPSNVVIGCHVTITSNWECPTSYERNSSFGGLDNFMTDTAMMLFYTRYDLLRQPCSLVILPDYEGYGDTADRPHPYLYQELTARQVVDATRYGLALYNAKVNSGDAKSLEKNWQSVCVGFSQGGSVSLATHKYIEMNNLVDELHFAGSVCGDGPYSPTDHLLYYMTDNGETYDGNNKTSHQAERVSMPIVMPLILKGMCDSNPYMRQNRVNEYLTQNFLNTGVLEVIKAKNNPNSNDQYSTGDVNKQFRKILKTGIYKDNTIVDKEKLFPLDDGNNVHGSLEYMLTPGCLDDFRRMTRGEAIQNDFMKNLVMALESNNLTVGWTPKKRIAFYHTTYDTVVPYVNLLTFMRNQDGLTYYFENSKNKPSERAGVRPTHTTTDETKADVYIIDTNSKKDHVPAGRSFYLTGGATSPDYTMMKWVLNGKK